MPLMPNLLAVEKCVTEVRMDRFPSPSEVSRFIAIHQFWVDNARVLQGDHWILDANQILLARDLGIIERLPQLSTEEIEDRSKADLLVKSIGLGQITWFIVQVITRLSQRVATSPLEIMTFAFAVSTAIAYFLLLDKPKDVGTSVVLPAVRHVTPQEISRLALAGPTTFVIFRNDVWIPNNAVHAADVGSGIAYNKHLVRGGMFSICIFGAIHCVAWDFAFPTDIEHLLWQVSAIVTVAVFPVVVLVASTSFWIARRLYRSHLRFYPRWFDISGKAFNFLAFILFLGARLFVLVEVIRSLAFLPVDAFLTTWSDNIPHIG